MKKKNENCVFICNSFQVLVLELLKVDVFFGNTRSLNKIPIGSLIIKNTPLKINRAMF